MKIVYYLGVAILIMVYLGFILWWLPQIIFTPMQAINATKQQWKRDVDVLKSRLIYQK